MTRGKGILRKIIIVLILAVTASAQFTAFTGALPFGVRPNLMLIGAVITGFCLSGELGGFAGFCLGLYQDAMCGKILGMYALFYLYSGVLAGLVSKWRGTQAGGGMGGTSGMGGAGEISGMGGTGGSGRGENTSLASLPSRLPAALICVYALSTVNELLLYAFAYVIPVLRTGTGVPGVGFINAVVSIILPTALINTMISLPYYLIIGKLVGKRPVKI